MLENMLTPVLPSHLNSLWGMDASKVGLVLLASVIPSIFGAQNVLYVLCHHLNGLRLFSTTNFRLVCRPLWCFGSHHHHFDFCHAMVHCTDSGCAFDTFHHSLRMCV